MRDAIYILIILSIIFLFLKTISEKNIEIENLRIKIYNIEKNLSKIEEENRILEEKLKILKKREQIVSKVPNILKSFILNSFDIEPKTKELRFYLFSKFVYKNISYEYEEKGDFWKHPIRTFFERKGDCEDRAILLCLLLKDDFDVYLVSCKNHTFCAIRYSCSEFERNILKEGFLANLTCYKGRFKVLYVENNVIRAKNESFELISPEAEKCDVVEIFDFKSFFIDLNPRENYKILFYPNISFEIKYNCYTICKGKVYVRNDGFYYVPIKINGVEKIVKDFEVFEFEGNKVVIKTPFGKKIINLK